jgi:hypothetical protein
VSPDGAGFVTLDAAGGDRPWLNVRRFRNEISPAARPGAVRPLAPGTLLVDSFYGQAFDFEIEGGRAVYGAAPDLPPYPGEERSFGFLRIPYRRIPRVAVASRAELEALVESVRQRRDGQGILLRGQTREHYLGRPAAVLDDLYGDPAALEPSLLASASRRNVLLESILPEWCAILRLYLAWVATVYQQRGDPDLPAFAARMRELGASADLHLLAISLAQHYGLPSMGLDVTDDLDVALFFALSDFTAAEGTPGLLRQRRKPAGGDRSVIYLFAPWERFQLRYLDYVPPAFPSGRPDQQRARFLHTGWGLNRNDCARALVMAIYLDPAGDYGELPSAARLFPGAADDPFGRFIEMVRSTWELSEELATFLGYLYWVEGD